MAEKEYIEREMLCNHIQNGAGTSMQKLFAECCVRSYPIAADVVEVVRCKDCQHYIDRRCYVGNRKPLFTYDVNIHSRKPNDFCSYGERKEDNR